MTFLSKFAGILLKGIAIATGLMPLVAQSFPGAGGVVTVVENNLARIVQIVVEIEMIGQLKGLPGAEKAKAAGPLVAQIILQSSLMSGKKIANAELFNQGCVNIAGGMADVLNSLHPDAAQEHKLT